jgi:uncharacterized membrane protein
MDTKTRSWAKSIVWRIIGIALLGVIAYAITGNWKEMTIITVLFHTIRMVLYYCHERIWERVSWGRLRHPLSELPVKEKPTPEDFKIIAAKLKELGYMD